MARKTDRRIERTRRWLRDAFVELFLEKNYDSITVQDITDRADTARVTFYRHYNTKDDLLEDWLSIVYSEIFTLLDAAADADLLNPDTSTPPLLPLVQHIDADRKLYRVLFSEQVAAVVRDRLLNYLAGQLTYAIEKQLPLKRTTIPLQMLAAHMAVAQLGLVIWWLQNDIPYGTTYIARAAHQLSLQGVRGVVSE